MKRENFFDVRTLWNESQTLSAAMRLRSSGIVIAAAAVAESTVDRIGGLGSFQHARHGEDKVVIRVSAGASG